MGPVTEQVVEGNDPHGAPQASMWVPRASMWVVGDSSAVGRGRPDHDQQHCYPQARTVNQRLLLQLL